MKTRHGLFVTEQIGNRGSVASRRRRLIVASPSSTPDEEQVAHPHLP
jgi:hypothetical protein